MKIKKLLKTTRLVLLTILYVISFTAFTPGSALALHAYIFGALDTLTSDASTESASDVKMAMLELSWSSYEPAQGNFSSSYAASMKSELQTFQQDGMMVTLGLGIHDTPSWVLSEPNGEYVDQYGNISSEADVVFNNTIRQQVIAYLQRINQDLGLSNFWAIRLTSGGNGEMLYPGNASVTNTPSYWTYDANAQNGSNLASGMPANPLPGWIPGQTDVTTAQVSNWVNWYVGALDNVTNFFINDINGLGYSGYYETVTPGVGTLPDGLQSDEDEYLSNSLPTTGVGAVWQLYYEGLSGIPNIIMYVSSMADQSGSPVNNTCQSSDDSVSLSSSTADSWSATRWLSRLADQYGFLKMGEPPDWSSTSWATSAQVSYYEDQSSSGLMAQTMDLMQSCNFLGVYWAHDNSLWGESTLPFSLYEQYVQLYQTPDVSFSSLTANEHIYSNSFAIPATASSNDDGNIASCELLVNGVNVATLTDSPYNFNLNTLGYSDGAYTVEVIAIDDEGNTNNSSASVLVTNGDLNSDGTVSLSDLAILATHWGETDSNYTDGNITGAATIGLSDLAVLAANWGWSD